MHILLGTFHIVLFSCTTKTNTSTSSLSSFFADSIYSMISPFYDNCQYKPYLGEHGLRKLVDGYVRKQCQKHNLKIPVDLLSIIYNYGTEFNFRYLSVPFYPSQTITLGRPFKKDTWGLDTITIYPRRIRPSIFQKNNCIVLGQLPTDSPKCFAWRMRFMYKMECCKKKTCQVGCIMVPKKKGYVQRFWNIIREHLTVHGIIELFADESVFGWWFCYSQRKRSYFKCKDHATSVIWNDRMVFRGQVTIYFNVNEDGDLTCDFNQNIKNYELLYKRFDQEYICFLTTVIPSCDCAHSYATKFFCDFAEKKNLRSVWF